MYQKAAPIIASKWNKQRSEKFSDNKTVHWQIHLTMDEVLCVGEELYVVVFSVNNSSLLGYSIVMYL